MSSMIVTVFATVPAGATDVVGQTHFRFHIANLDLAESDQRQLARQPLFKTPWS
jgi:hypothetical protein